MRNRLVIADTGRLVCDGGDLGPIEYSIWVLGDETEAHCKAGGSLTGHALLAALEPSQTAEIITSRFGPVLVQIHEVDDDRLEFRVTSGSVVLGIDPPEAPDLQGPADQRSANLTAWRAIRS